MARQDDSLRCDRCKCLSCNPLCELNVIISSELLRPGGTLYQLAVKENGPLKEGVVYTFPTLTDLVFVFESTKNTLVTLSNKNVTLDKQHKCHAPSRLSLNRGVCYQNGDRTMTPVIGGNRCGCGFKHFWNGKEYDNMPESFPIILEYNGRTILETVHWFQGETDPNLNSNAFEVAEELVLKHFPGFGTKGLENKVVDIILNRTTTETSNLSYEGGQPFCRPQGKSTTSSRQNSNTFCPFTATKISTTVGKMTALSKETDMANKTDQKIKSGAEKNGHDIQTRKRQRERGKESTPSPQNAAKVPKPNTAVSGSRYRLTEDNQSTPSISDAERTSSPHLKALKSKAAAKNNRQDENFLDKLETPIKIPRVTASIASYAFPSASYTFHNTCGANIAVTCGEKKAKRINTLQCPDESIVLTSQPLYDDELFEVRLDSIVGRWSGSLVFGATTVKAVNFQFPRLIKSCSQGTTFALSTNKILKNGKERATIPNDLTNLLVGDRIGLMRKSDGTLHFFINGINVGKKINGVPAVLYGIVDVFGRAEGVTITGGGEKQNNSKDLEDYALVINRMSTAVKFLRERQCNDSILPVVSKVAKCILQPCEETHNQELRRMCGDYLSDVNALYFLTSFLSRLLNEDITSRGCWLGICIVLSIFRYYSAASSKLASRCLEMTALLEALEKGLDGNSIKCSTNEDRKFVVSSIIKTLHCFSEVSEGRQAHFPLPLIEKIVPHQKADDMEVAVLATLTYLNVASRGQKRLLEVDSRVLSYFLGMFRNALDQPDLQTKSTETSLSAQEITLALDSFLVNHKNMETMLDREVVPLLFSFIAKGKATGKEKAIESLLLISESSKGKAQIMSYVGANYGKPGIQEAAKRLGLELKRPQATQGVSEVQRRVGCDYQERCRRFKSSLELSDVFFDSNYDRCYCAKCHEARGDKLYYSRGKPSKPYGLPIGWCRFGLKVHHRAVALDVFNNWHAAFHGTRIDSVKAILECGDLLIPGDVALGGRKLNEEEGHFNDKRKPSGFDTKQIFVSPSIRYSGLSTYAKPKRFVDPVTKKTLNAKVVLQLYINPNSYRVGPQTIAASSEIDPKFTNQEIEWFTKERGSIILYGLLVKLEEAS